MMDDGVVVLLIYAVAMTCAGLVFGVGWWRNWRRVRELERMMLDRLLPPPESGLPYEVSRQMEALSEQVDRLAEGQEFLARVMAERPALGDHREAPRMSTPH